jgi:hypothetical protein
MHSRQIFLAAALPYGMRLHRRRLRVERLHAGWQRRRGSATSIAVTPPREWNKISASLFVDIHAVEDWTQNGPYLDGSASSPVSRMERRRSISATATTARPKFRSK